MRRTRFRAQRRICRLCRCRWGQGPRCPAHGNQRSQKRQTAVLFLNDGRGGFGQMKGAAFEGVYYSALAFADIDGDGDPDVLLSGLNRAGDPITTLYKNDGMATSGIDLRRGPDSVSRLSQPRAGRSGAHPHYDRAATQPDGHPRYSTQPDACCTGSKINCSPGRIPFPSTFPGWSGVRVSSRVEDGAKTGTQKVLIL